MAWTLFNGGEVVALSVSAYLSTATRALAPAVNSWVTGRLLLRRERERRGTITTVMAALPHGDVTIAHDGGQGWEVRVSPHCFPVTARRSTR
ncbi:hypothetical protein AB0H73_25495 [Streptomyces olivoreticuli]|uniref:hypothetical protein n=1 Tax=Streptomyces olivoreticuli TaxID=68246 RepID=UPI000E28253F|nr:hypothetical protein [Streptomyces olivoreticuli]